mmetsp:Transcript_4051/g.5968  ORF Transcript_4051/g.5968 Transcript_4051/m.5968 type:complete len:410 (-) Transcript_4051:204-1433(-)
MMLRANRVQTIIPFVFFFLLVFLAISSSKSEGEAQVDEYTDEDLCKIEDTFYALHENFTVDYEVQKEILRKYTNRNYNDLFKNDFLTSERYIFKKNCEFDVNVFTIYSGQMNDVFIKSIANIMMLNKNICLNLFLTSIELKKFFSGFPNINSYNYDLLYNDYIKYVYYYESKHSQAKLNDIFSSIADFLKILVILNTKSKSTFFDYDIVFYKPFNQILKSYNYVKMEDQYEYFIDINYVSIVDEHQKELLRNNLKRTLYFNTRLYEENLCAKTWHYRNCRNFRCVKESIFNIKKTAHFDPYCNHTAELFFASTGGFLLNLDDMLKTYEDYEVNYHPSFIKFIEFQKENFLHLNLSSINYIHLYGQKDSQKFDFFYNLYFNKSDHEQLVSRYQNIKHNFNKICDKFSTES